MAIDILTFNGNVEGYKSGENVNGRLRENIFDVTLSAQYPANGYTLYDATLTKPRYGQLGMKTIMGVEWIGENAAAVAAGSLLVYDTTLKAIRVGTVAGEFAENTNVSTLTFRLKFIGAS